MLRRILMLALVLGGPCCGDACGAPPRYLLLRAPTVNKGKDQVRTYVPATTTPVTANSYRYGWFGAQRQRPGWVKKPRRTWTRHYGHQRKFTQWSSR